MSTPEDIAVYGVKLGYKVVEAQIKRGQDAARRLRRASIASGGGDVGDMVDKGLRLYKHAGVLFVELAETLVSSPNLFSFIVSKIKQTDQGGSGGSSGESDLNATLAKIVDALPAIAPLLAGRSGGAGEDPAQTRYASGSQRTSSLGPYAICIQSKSRKAQSKLSLWSKPGDGQLRVKALHNEENGEVRIEDVKFAASQAGEPIQITIVIGDQPPGTYSGIVFGSAGDHVGTLTVNVHA